MNADLLKARLNLHVVLRNLEDLPLLDPQTAEMIQDWRLAIHFAVRGAFHTGLVFNEGQCRLYDARPPHADLKLFFFSPAHANAMFAGASNPVPLKGFSKLRFLKNDFVKLTQRLEHFLRPAPEKLKDDDYLLTNTLLTLYTAVFAVKHVAELDATASQLAAATPRGSMQFVVEPDGPVAHIIHGETSITAGKGPVEHPSAIMWFADWTTLNQTLAGGLPAFAAAGKGSLRLEGNIPILDNTGLIMDRVGEYLA